MAAIPPSAAPGVDRIPPHSAGRRNSPEQVRDPALLVKQGKADVRAIADELRRWSV
ncbi:FIG131131: hypothetical toxin [Streptomyces globisporus]|uniref:FIG131131: hypothetical toxin n=1 Tax=Streptomyces globisporus TaxID=1908 RepID=A0ABM9H477_STRGL|nr:FIG131131: hypothetical toxin [Streptomyces globisporus]